MNQVIDYTVFIGKRNCEKKLCIVINLFKKFRQNFVQVITLFYKEHTEQFIKFIFVFKLHNLILLNRSKVQVGIKGSCNKIGLTFGRIFRRKHTNTGSQIVIDFHKSYSNKTVKPSIGNFFNYIFKCFFVGFRAIFFFLDSICKFGSLLDFIT